MIQNLAAHKGTMVEHGGNLVGFKVLFPDKQLAFLILTLNREQLSVKDSIQLARYANEEGLRVVFVPDVSHESIQQEFLSVEAQRDLLDVIAYHSTEDIKTAVLAGYGDWVSTVDYNWSAVAYSYNQVVNGKVCHAESVLADFLTVRDLKPTWWLMMLEPCSHCLRDMLNHGAEVIVYMNEHKDKWNTDTYLELKQQLTANRIKTNQSQGAVPVLYIREVFSR